MASALAAHIWVDEVVLSNAYDDDVVVSFVDAACVRQVSAFTLCFPHGYDIIAQNMVALTRLLLSSSLKTLEIVVKDDSIRDESRMAQLHGAFQASTLTHLKLVFQLYKIGGNIACVIDAAAAIPRLRSLKVAITQEAQVYLFGHIDDAALGRVFGLLLARNMPSLHTLDMRECSIGSEALMQLLAGLSGNTHLRKLELNYRSHPHFYGFTDDRDPIHDLARDFLEPALKALAERAE